MKASLSASAVRFVVKAAAAAGARPDRLASELGLAAGPDTRVSAQAVSDLWFKVAAAVGDPDFGVRLGCSYQPGTLGLIDFLFLSSATVADGFAAVIDNVGIVTTGGACQMHDDGDALTISRVLPESVVNSHATGFLIGWQLALVRAGMGRPVTPPRIGLAHPAPRRYKSFIEAFGAESVEFDQPATTMTFRRGDVQGPLLSADLGLAALLCARAQTLRPTEHAWRAQVQRLLADGLWRHDVSLEAAATRMAISPRRLQQLLQQEGSSWRAELETARTTLATELLSGSGLSVTAVAARLGYSDVRAFRRAFQRWHGHTPQEFRVLREMSP